MAKHNYIQVEDLHKGLNLMDDPSSLAEGECVDCVGWDLTVAGELKTLKIDGAHDLTTNVPTGVELTDLRIEYIGSTRYVICGSATGLYINGVLKTAASVVSYIDTASDGKNIYIICDLGSYRWDGTNLRQLGITPPGDVDPAITAVAQSTKILIDGGPTAAFTGYNAIITSVAGGSPYPSAITATNIICFTPTAGVEGFGGYYSFSPASNWTVFDDAAPATDEDLLVINVCVPNTSIYQLQVQALTAATSDTNFYTYTIVLPAAESLGTIVSDGGTVVKVPYVPSTPHIPEPPPEDPTGGAPRFVIYPVETPTKKEMALTSDMSTPYLSDAGATKTVTTGITTSSGMAGYVPGAWHTVKIPLKMFVKVGNPGAWSSILALFFRFYCTGKDNAACYIDDIKLVGGGSLTGKYYFMYGWARIDASNNVLEYSGPARDASGNLQIQGPIDFERQKVAYAARTASTDAQVGACVIYITGGSLADWWVGGVITNNTTAAGNLDISEKTINKRMISLKSRQAPAGSSIIWYQNRLWMAGLTAAGEGNKLQFSDISIDGDIAPTSWPDVNAIRLGGTGCILYDLVEVNRILVARTSQAEYSIFLQNPADPGSITVNKTGSFAAVTGVGNQSKGYLKFANLVIYPTASGWVQTDGSNPKLLSPKFTAITAPGYTPHYLTGATKTYEGYIPYSGTSWTAVLERTVKLDFYSGTPRFTFLNPGLYPNHLAVVYDSMVNKVYAVHDPSQAGVSVVKILEAAAPDGTTTVTFKSRGYRHPTAQRAVWKRLMFYCDTGGTSYTLTVTVYVDGVEMGNRTFAGASGSRTEIRYDFGPFPGEFFQFKFSGTLSAAATIYMPMRIYCDATD